jgi:hypothetical protein
MPDINGITLGIPDELRAATEALGSPHDQEVVLRALSSLLVERLRFARQAGLSFGDLRNMYAVLGYDETLTTSRIRARYNRGGIAGRIVDAMPKATWREGFEIYEDENPDVETPFELAIKTLDDRLSLAAKFHKTDILAGLSTFSVLLIGVGDGALDQPLPKGNGTPDNVIFLQPFSGGGGQVNTSYRHKTVADDADARVDTYIEDPKDPRFGQPATYQIRRTYTTDITLARTVHWSRVLHVAHQTLDDNVYGSPTLERVWNLLDDLDKVTGGGAEAFWLRANQGTALKVDADAKLSPEEKTELEQKVEEYANQMRRFMVMRKAELQSMGSDVANFSNPADAILTQIAGATGIPKRILTGSEMGELASSQDRENWRDQVRGRQTREAGPYIVKPFIQRLIDYNYLPAVKKGNIWQIEWPNIEAMTETEKADGANKWATANKTQGTVVFTDDEIREHWYGMEPLTPDQKVPIAAPEKITATTEPAQDNTPPLDAAPVLLKAAGDVAGHEFHGNQYSGSDAIVKKSLDEPGEHHVTFPDGRQYAIYRDASSSIKGWETVGLENSSAGGAAFNKKEMLDHLGKLNENRPYVDKHSGYKSGKTVKEHLDSIRAHTKYRTAETAEDVALLQALTAAIESNNVEVIDRILGTKHPLDLRSQNDV